MSRLSIKGNLGPQGPNEEKRNGEDIGLKGEPGSQGNEAEVGLQGPSGVKGDKGNEGPKGSSGPTDAIGPLDPQGPESKKGELGKIGPERPRGWKGEKGSLGVGIQGPRGLNGTQGLQGLKGIKCEIGSEGKKGNQGITGLKGDKGNLGVQEPKGIDGPAGTPGLKGEAGPKGDKGIQGPQGFDSTHWKKAEIGTQGIDGLLGISEAKGETGSKGEKGDMGCKGVDELSEMPGPKGDQGDIGPVGPKGDRGDSGIDASPEEVANKELEYRKKVGDLILEQQIAGRLVHDKNIHDMGDDMGAPGSIGLQSPVGPHSPKGEDGIGVSVTNQPSTIGNLFSLVKQDEYKLTSNEQPSDEECYDASDNLNKGNLGVQVPKGIDGPAGTPGLKGEAGPKGDKGMQCFQGFDSTHWKKAEIGTQGIDGLLGISEAKGETGSKGEKGDMGGKGVDELSEMPGPKGDQGDIGPVGPKGDRGDSGIDASPEEVANKELEYRKKVGDLILEQQIAGRLVHDKNIHDMGDGMGAPGSIGLQSPVGPHSPKGEDGIGVSVTNQPSTIGNLFSLVKQDEYKLTSNEQPSDECYDASDNLNKGNLGVQVPKGIDGPAGTPGLKGEADPKGNKGIPGPQGFDSTHGKKAEIGTQGIDGLLGVSEAKGETGSKGEKGDMGGKGVDGLSEIPEPKGDQGDIGPVGPKDDRGDKVSQNLLSSSAHSSDEEYCDANDNLNEVERSSLSCEGDSDLESIPTVPHFKQHIWKGSHHIKVGNIHRSDLDQSKKGISKKFNQDKNQYIKENIEDGKLVYSGKLSCGGIDMKIHGSGSLLTSNQDNFVAIIKVDNQEGLNFTKPFIDVKRKLYEKLVVTEVLKDELLDKRNEIYSNFKKFLLNRTAEDLLQLSIAIEKCKKSNDTAILTDITTNKYISTEFKNITKDLLSKEKALRNRNKNFPKFDNSAQSNIKSLLAELRQICKEGINLHRNTLLDKYFRYIYVMAPSVMIDHLSDLHDKSIFYISNEDMVLFADLVDVMGEQPFLDLVGDAWNALFKRIKDMWNETQGKLASSQSLTHLTHPIYFYLCKSFKELILEIIGKTDISINELLHKDKQGKFSLIKNINWLSTSPLNLSLEQQYRFVFELMKHFKPGYYSSKRSFEYKFKLLENSEDKTLWKSIKSWFVSSDKLLAIPEERLVWIYILDNAIANLISKEKLTLFKSLITGYIYFVSETKGDHFESFRIVTHNVARFITQTRPFLSKEVSKIDQDILTKQIESIKNAFLDRQSDDFRDLVDVYNEYWKNRQSILEKISDKFPYGKFKQDMEEIRQTLLNIASTILDQKAKSQGLIKCFRSFNEFLEDLNVVEFSWFIKETNNSNEVDLVNSDKKSYKVSNPENFIKKCGNIPKHYLIEIIQDLLNSVRNLLRQKKWSSDDNLGAASELLSAIKKSFLYLKEQPNYVSFDTFKEENTKPFISVVDNSSSYEDFKKRISKIGESFWYIRKQDEIDIDKALVLYGKENYNGRNEILRNCYSRYLEKFESYIQEISGKNYQDKIEFVINEVKKQSEEIKINKWSSKFKRETLPDFLAGLAVVWSIQESKDIASTGKSLKPHCIQILCILRLLSVDKDSKGVDKHLSQVLTGQGKSLVLGLLSSLLALTSHKVRTVCYSEYLATRDQQDFDDFFEQFDIRDKITYGTFEEMANAVLKPKVNGKEQGLRELVKERILNHSAEQVGQIKQEDASNTILLIDEVDVFFSDQFYGNTYGACNTIGIPGLASIQEEIWGMASKSYEKSTILKELEEFINKKIGERNQDFIEFNIFLFKPGNYYLLKEDEVGVVIKKEYTNRSLYQEHLEEMIDTAIQVVKGSGEDWFINKYKINDEGIISYRRSDGEYSISTYSGYFNIFTYFRLKKKDFNLENYGYLNIYCGKVSYAKLPEKYPLILGVSGTLTTLNDHEKKAVRESYNIRENSIMPSFFGDSHLKFNSTENFTSQNSEEEWLSKVFSHANSKVGSGQSVLIFFDTDVEIRKFKEKFFGKFDRLHILTENTEKHAKEKYIDEAGITKTITLATRGMGRGVDFKSSVAVEKGGGVHVIQTFFSLDIKEETQIKGRTARKDNKGSYELILCKKHLISAGILEGQDAAVDYQSLNKTRNLMIEEKRSNDEERIKKSESCHKTTIDFLESFFQ